MRSPRLLARMAALPLVALAAVGVHAQDAKPLPPAIPLPTAAPKGAIVLLDGKAETFAAQWLKRNSAEPAGWTFTDGVVTPNRTDITSKQSFGDFFLHVEFKCPTTGHGNAGIGLQGRYEVQIYASHGKKPEETNAAAFYSQKPASVEASKPAGEWQTYDIVFRAPRFNAEGKVVEPARATVFFNGILVHANNDFLGPTGIQYGDFKDMAKTGPIVLQGDHDAVQYRNIWVIPL